MFHIFDEVVGLSAFERDLLRAERQRAFWSFICSLCRERMSRKTTTFRTSAVQIWDYG